MRVGIVVWLLMKQKGGLERVGASLANEMHARGHEVTVFYSLKHGQGQPQYPMREGIARVGLDAGACGKGDILGVRRAIEAARPDVMVAMFSWKDLLIFPVAMLGLGIPLVISEHSHPEYINWLRWNRTEREAAMAGADAIHVLSESFRAMFPASMRERITVIPNPVPQAARQASLQEPSPARIILAAGRFEDEVKQFSLLIKAFGALAGKCPGWELHIHGDGGDRGLYEALVRSLGLEGRVRLMGKTDRIEEKYAEADLVCTPSLYEGFSLVTAEAQRHGLPAVGFADCSGVNEIILDGHNGLLAPAMTPDSLAETLARVMLDDGLRRTLGENARKTSARYDPALVYDAWEDLLASTAGKAGRTRLCGPDGRDSGDAYLRNLRTLAERENLFQSVPGERLAATPYNEKADRSLFHILEFQANTVKRLKRLQAGTTLLSFMKQAIGKVRQCATAR